ncbi:MAG: DUF2103 domain-containing protein [Halobacteriaceae archaeon]
MDCRRCGTPLQRPGDYCLVCHTANADRVVVAATRERATLSILDDDGTVLGEPSVTTSPETGEQASAELRNYVGRVADEIQRKRPEAVYVAGDRDVIRELTSRLHYDVYRIPGEDPVEEVRARRNGRPLEVVDRPAAEKIGGSHSTLIGGRDGQRVVREVAAHPHVKKVVPGPIESGGNAGTTSGVRAKATRADGNGNVRVLLRDGSSVQENRVITTAMNRESGERVRADLNEALAEAGLAG